MQLLALPIDEADDTWTCAWSQALDAEELSRAERFHRAADRMRYIAAHALLRTALGAATGEPPAALTFARGSHGKPFLPAFPALHFSLTHTAGLAAIALHSSPVGYDAEPMNRHVDEAVFTMLAREERAWLLGLKPGVIRKTAFIRLWVMKEAYLKATGLGLSLALNAFAFCLAGDTIGMVRAPTGREDIGWQFLVSGVGQGHVAGLAVQGARTPLALPCAQMVSADGLADAAIAARR